MFSLFIKDYEKFARHLILCIVACVMTLMCVLVFAVYFWKRYMFSLFFKDFKKLVQISE